MRLLVSAIPFDGGRSGISVYAREVVHALLAAGCEVAILAEPGNDSFDGIGCNAIHHAPRWTRRAVFSMAWHLFLLPFWIWRRRKNFDGFVICAANRRVSAWYPVKTVATVHDLANFHIPGKYSRARMFYLAHVLPFFAKRAQRLVAVSESTKNDMVRFWHCKSGDISVLYNGLPPELLQKVDCNARPGGGKLLYISRIEHPGKNHARLIEAYSRLPRELAEKHPLVLAGAPWKDAEVAYAARENSPYKDFISFTGFVDDIEALWADAGFYVFPSLFEGFGLSLAEAMARGVPCACSNNGSLGEIAGDAAITFDPCDVESIAGALARLLSEAPEKRDARIRRGFEHVKRFSWQDHAKGMLKLLNA